MQFLARHHEPIDISLGGVRIFSDDKMRVGELLKMEFFLPDVEPVTYTAEVVWIEPLPAGSPARFDVGLKFIQLEPGAINLLMGVLGPPEDLVEGDGDGEEGEAAALAPPADKASGTGR
jgi:hypothetical protein